MTDINDLRERVEAAEERFGLLDEQQRHYSERVIGLIETIEAQLAAARGEIEKQIDENLRLGQDLAAARSEIEQQVDANLRLSQENEELRTMLHSVLHSIEQKTHMKTLQDLEARVSALVAGAGTAPAASEAPLARSDDGDPAGGAAIEAPVEVPVQADAVVEAAEIEHPGHAPALIVAAEDADTEVEAAAEAGAPGEHGQPSLAEESLPEQDAFEEGPVEEGPVEEGPVEEGMADESVAGEAMAEEDADDNGTGEEPPAEPSAAETGDDGEDLFAAMAELNASDEDWAAAQGTEPGEAATETETAVASPGDEAATGVEEAVAGVASADGPEGPSSAAAAEVTAEATDPADEGAAPTVKEIIRRVGDLARELERAEAARRAARGGETDSDGSGAEMEFPPLHQAASG